MATVTVPAGEVRGLRRVASRLAGIAEVALTPHGVDRYLELVEPTWSVRDVRGRVERVERPTRDSVTLHVRPNRNWAGFQAGQFVTVTVEIDGVQHTRCYSPASSARRAGTFELTVKRVPDGTVSTWLHANARPGLVLGLSQAQGSFTLPADLPPAVLLLSGGSGITPVLSMLRTLGDDRHRGEVVFVHYALTVDDMIARRDVEALAAAHPNVRLVRVFTDEPGTGDLDGFLDEAQLDAIHPAWRSTPVWVCGPEAMMRAATECWTAAGAPELVHVEAFAPPATTAPAPGQQGTVRFTATDASVVDDGRPILEQAEAAGLTPAYGCRMGICHTCTRTLCSGSVRDLVTGEVTNEPGAPVRICVSVADGDAGVDL